MKLGKKLPYRLFVWIFISLFDKHIIRSFHDFKCMGKLPLPQKSWIFSKMLRLNFMYEAWKAKPNYGFIISSATFVMPNWHFGAHLINWVFLWRNRPKMTYVSQRDVSWFIHSQTNISSRLMKFGTKISYSLLVQNHISLCDNHITHSL